MKKNISGLVWPAVIYVLILCQLAPQICVSEQNALSHECDRGEWLSNYFVAARQAQCEEKFLLIHFTDSHRPATSRAFRDIIQKQETAAALASFVLLEIPVTDSKSGNQQPKNLYENTNFAEIASHPGLAILDFQNCDHSFYEQVVTVYPFHRRQQISAHRLSLVLSLPPGTLTQRMLILAVRCHEDRPQSAWGKLHPVLVDAAENHSLYQAEKKTQGHHDWNVRFHQLNAQLSKHYVVQEVCSESWPGQSLFEAAFECVRSWRQSSGHWKAVSGTQVFFAYDMKKGANGVWYATGNFAR